jgi:LPS-assembly protein
MVAPAAGAQNVKPASTPSAPAAPAVRPLVTQEEAGTSAKPSLRLEADEIRGRPDREVVAEGRVRMQRGDLRLAADRLTYDIVEDLAHALGGVSIERPGARLRGPELSLQVQRFEGILLAPEFDFERGGISAGGSARRIEFIGQQRSVATEARYTGCPRDGSADPAWLLTVQRLSLDDERSEGVAEGATLRFMGVPLVSLPTLSFSLNNKRRSGWLPPNVNLDNRSGFELAVPWYWNLAENRDATLTPHLRTRRGPGLEAEFRYLEPRDRGELTLDWLPQDREVGRARYGLTWTHESQTSAAAPPRAGWLEGLRYRAQWMRVSDNDWWKDFPRSVASFTPRLLPQELSLERDLSAFLPWRGLPGTQVYARIQRWQVLQSVQDGVQAPYQRLPQLGLRSTGSGVIAGRSDWHWRSELELNRFVLPRNSAGASVARPDGWRAHALLQGAWRLGSPSLWMEPGVALNMAAYRTDTAMADSRRRAARAIPSYSVEAGALLERNTTLFGRTLRQTLEPRLLYVDTPFREQSALPNFDSAEKDFNFSSLYSANAFEGIDRVSDGQQLTAGITSRFYDAQTGAEWMRLAAVQRYRFQPQRVVLPTDTDPNPPPLAREVSDLLVLGNTSLGSRWKLDLALQFNPDIGRLTRAVAAARYTAGDFRTISTAYRLARSAAGQLTSEQLEFAGQWPLWRSAGARASNREGATCSGALYGVGRVKFSLLDNRLTDSILGLEYDGGCWIGRVIAERVSTGRSDATTRLMVQLELLGLSRLGSNPLRTLKDNVPGYRLLREDVGGPLANP